MSVPRDILDIVGAVKSEGEAVAVAMVARAESGAPAKPGDRIVIASDGGLSADWLAGAERDALLRAAREAVADGRARRVAVRLKGRRGEMDLLVEPLLPRPVLLICGASPVAAALSEFARRMGFFVTVCAPLADHAAFPEADRLVDGCAPPKDLLGALYVALAAREAENRAALPALARLRARYLAVIGPCERPAALRRALGRNGAAVKIAAGLDIGAVTPEEIALSIVAEMVSIRRSAPVS
jgi:xanthine dehydrogenase accessory factor